MKIRLVLPSLAVVLSLLSADCSTKCQSASSLHIIPLDARDSPRLVYDLAERPML